MSAGRATSTQGFQHEAMFYRGAGGFLAGTVPFLREGIAKGEAILVVESSAKIEMLRSELGGEARSVEFADMAAIGANPARIIPAWADFVSQHARSGRGLRGIGEPIWKERTADQLIECQRHESLLNVAFSKGEPWHLLCPYDAEALPPEVIEEAGRSHNFVSDGHAHSQSSTFRGFDGSGAPFDVPLPEPAGPTRDFKFKAEDLYVMRALVRQFATESGLRAALADELVTAVNEVATNSLRHGGGAGHLRIWREPDRVSCEISDGGRIANPLVDRERPAADIRASRGLWLANQLCDLIQIRTLASGTVVRLHMWRPN
jgi:anti-sigma regulatory factor (Ser/Thr protein kinase)